MPSYSEIADLPELDEIRRAIYQICYDVEQKIAGQQDRELLHWWAEKNAFRHGLVLRSILRCHAAGNSKDTFKVLNLSGMGIGHQDFSICQFLKDRLPLHYSAVEHPNTPFRNMDFFVSKVEELQVQIIFRDLKQLSAADIRAQIGGDPDIILFTEIAEHLEHGTFLRSLQLIAELLPSHGRLLLSTPNADALAYRLEHLLGRDRSHWGDGTENMEKGLFGHIVYYNIPRLGRLLRDVGLEIGQGITVNFPLVDPKLSSMKSRFERFKLGLSNGLIGVGEKCWRVPALKDAMNTLGELLYLEIRKGSTQRIPFAL